MNAPNAPSLAQLRGELLDERDRHEATRAQLEIVGEELRTASEQLALAVDALAIARAEKDAMRRQLQAYLLEQNASEERIMHALHGSPTTVFGQDMDLRYVWACATPFGLLPDEVIGHRDADLFSAEQADALSTIKREVLRALRPFHEIVALTIAGRVRRVDIYLKPVEDDAGAIAGICGVATHVLD